MEERAGERRRSVSWRVQPSSLPASIECVHNMTRPVAPASLRASYRPKLSGPAQIATRARWPGSQRCMVESGTGTGRDRWEPEKMAGRCRTQRRAAGKSNVQAKMQRGKGVSGLQRTCLVMTEGHDGTRSTLQSFDAPSAPSTTPIPASLARCGRSIVCFVWRISRETNM